MKKKFLISFALCGLGVAILLAAARIYMLHNASPHDDVLNEGWFDILTLILWPSAIYLGILKSAEPAKVVFVVYSIAVSSNAIIYGGVGWLVWRFARFMELVKPD